MIQLSDLRVGNYVKCKVSNDAGIYKVLSLDGWMLRIMLDGVRQNEWHPERLIQPIPLTEPLLEKCGFTKVRSKYEYAETYDFYLDIFYFDIANQSTRINGYHCLSFIPEHLHQLQNLYYALTGKELEITI